MEHQELHSWIVIGSWTSTHGHVINFCSSISFCLKTHNICFQHKQCRNKITFLLFKLLLASSCKDKKQVPKSVTPVAYQQLVSNAASRCMLYLIEKRSLNAFMSPTCRPGANPFILHWFGDCIYNGRDLAGFLLGIASILSWMVAQVPQLMANYRNKSADALSAFFLAEWLLGDTCNLLGALLKGDQLSTVVFTAQYFICMDVVLLVQYIYYTSYQRRREHIYAAKRRRLRHHKSHRRTKVSVNEGSAAEYVLHQRLAVTSAESIPSDERGLDTCTDSDVQHVGSSNVDSNGRDFVFRPQRALACVGVVFLITGLQQTYQKPLQQQQLRQQEVSGRRHLQAAGSLAAKLMQEMPEWSQDVGTVVAYCSSVLYLTSRISQIYKNYKRQSAEGLALSMFFCAITANTLYGLSIVVRAYSFASIQSSAPWLIGSLGTVALDATIFVQALVFGTEKKHTSDEEEQLLSGDAASKH